MAVTPNYGWPIPVATDYVKDGYDAIADLGNAIDTTVAGLGSGLTLVQTQNPSASTGISFTGLSAGKRYRLMTTVYASSAGNNMGLRFKDGGTDVTTGYYGAGYYAYYGGGTGGYTLNNNSRVWLVGLNNSIPSPSVFDVFIPTTGSAFVLGLLNDFNNGNTYYLSGYRTGLTNVNGLSIYPESGTFTGKISLYEYE